ncbi:Rossmann fold nucleotide-binding protein [Intrasporangium sp.]|uniref:LOG family protein n=1 Tax=Intrasporangium sp. TaxID=1925024 RepID=UPI002939F6AE|nr:Rossmann fold nucleotide-binding protein [Intrasporangium sp.]MDV3221192.1 LOG family protein [Intrasporangium sp.]
MEIETLEALDDHLEDGGSLHGLRLQNLDLTDYAVPFGAHGDLTGLVVLGGIVPTDVADVLNRGGAIVFPQIVDAPIDPWRGLYYPEDLYAGLEDGYAATPDARAYAWSIDGRLRTDAYSTLVRAIHDDSVTDDLDEFVEGRSAVGVMGGHALLRGTAEYAAAAELGRRLAESGHVVITGGGPGAMEAANLGAFVPDAEALGDALPRLAPVPSFRPDVTPWARVAMDVRRDLLGDEPLLPAETLGPSARSLGVPTWFYGHEPPNVFCDVVAKYFSNAIREDGILARSNCGIVVLPGAAGTVQEIFQAVTPLYYAADDVALPPLVLVGRKHWTESVPVWSTLQRLARGRPMAEAIHVVDSVEDALALLPPARA